MNVVFMCSAAVLLRQYLAYLKTYFIIGAVLSRAFVILSCFVCNIIIRCCVVFLLLFVLTQHRAFACCCDGCYYYTSDDDDGV